MVVVVLIMGLEATVVLAVVGVAVVQVAQVELGIHLQHHPLKEIMGDLVAVLHQDTVVAVAAVLVLSVTIEVLQERVGMVVTVLHLLFRV